MICFDSPTEDAFGFAPAISPVVTCQTPDEVDAAFAELSAGGQLLMPLDRYPFSARFGWVTDRAGVSRQLIPE